MTIPPYHARSIYNSRMHLCPAITPGSRLSRTKDRSRVRPAAHDPEQQGFHAIFEFEKLYQVHRNIA